MDLRVYQIIKKHMLSVKNATYSKWNRKEKNLPIELILSQTLSSIYAVDFSI